MHINQSLHHVLLCLLDKPLIYYLDETRCGTIYPKWTPEPRKLSVPFVYKGFWEVSTISFCSCVLTLMRLTVAQYEMLANVANYVDLASSKFLIIALVALHRVLAFSCSHVLVFSLLHRDYSALYSARRHWHTSVTLKAFCEVSHDELSCYFDLGTCGFGGLPIPSGYILLSCSWYPRSSYTKRALRDRASSSNLLYDGTLIRALTARLLQPWPWA